MELLKTLYEVVGAPHPRLSLVVVTLVGALIFGGGWWLIGKNYELSREMPRQSSSEVPGPATSVATLVDARSHPLSDPDEREVILALSGRDQVRTRDGLSQDLRLSTDRVENVLIRLQRAGLVTNVERESKYWWRLTPEGRALARTLIGTDPEPAVRRTDPGDPAARVEELLENGGFEAGLQGWGTGWLEDLPALRSQITPHSRHVSLGGAVARWSQDFREKKSGVASLRIEHDTPYAPHVYTSFSQRIKIRRGSNYELRFWVKCEAVDDSGGLVVRVAPSTEDWDRFKDQIRSRPRGKWREVRVPFSWDAAFVDVRFSGEGRVRAWIDDVTVVELQS